MKYKAGDKVRVREDLVVDNIYGKYRFAAYMKKYSGKTMTVNNTAIGDAYKLKEDVDRYNWTDEMFEDVESINIIVDGNKVIAKKGGKVGVAKCSPEDKFDIFTGARLAINRLEEKCMPYGWLKEGMGYYRPDINIDMMYTYATYYNDDIDKRLMSRGLVFETKEEAVVAAKKMLAVLKGGKDDD